MSSHRYVWDPSAPVLAPTLLPAASRVAAQASSPASAAATLLNSRAPKEPKTGYDFFCDMRRPQLLVEYPEAKPAEISKMLGEGWKQLNTAELREPYEAQAAADRRSSDNDASISAATTKCDECGDDVYDDDGLLCDICSSRVCETCQFFCDSCDQCSCAACHEAICDVCEEVFCSDCCHVRCHAAFATDSSAASAAEEKTMTTVMSSGAALTVQLRV